MLTAKAGTLAATILALITGGTIVISLTPSADDMTTIINAAQQAHYKSTGRYFQALPTSDTAPMLSVSPDFTKKMADRADGQTAALEDFIPKPLALPFSFAVDTMDYPDGTQGYQITYKRSTVGGDVEVKRDGVGKDVIQHDWTRVDSISGT